MSFTLGRRDGLANVTRCVSTKTRRVVSASSAVCDRCHPALTRRSRPVGDRARAWPISPLVRSCVSRSSRPVSASMRSLRPPVRGVPRSPWRSPNRSTPRPRPLSSPNLPRSLWCFRRSRPEIPWEGHGLRTEPCNKAEIFRPRGILRWLGQSTIPVVPSQGASPPHPALSHYGA